MATSSPWRDNKLSNETSGPNWAHSCRNEGSASNVQKRVIKDVTRDVNAWKDKQTRISIYGLSKQ